MLYYKKHISGNPYSTLERWFDLLYPFLEKGVLFWMILISVAATIDTIHPLPVISLLLALTISALAQAFPKNWLSSVCLGGYFLLCSCYPPILLTMPLLLYDAIRAKKWYLSIFAVGALLHIATFSVLQICLFCGLIPLSILLGWRAQQWKTWVQTAHQQHDHASELQQKLTQRNRQLQTAQNDAVRMATLQERNRIAREIHDNVGHMLTRALLQTGALAVCVKEEPLKASVAALQKTLDSAMTSIRSSVHKLHDDAIPLEKSVQDCLQPLKDTYHITLTYDISEQIPSIVKLCLLGVLKESLSNVVKHSNGDAIQIVLREHPAFYQLSITDNGTGSHLQQTGIGLETMQDRAEQVHGLIRFFPEKDSFRVFLSIPKS